MKSQEAAFKAHRKPKKAKKEVVQQSPATPAKVKKNKARDERRVKARRVRALLRAQKEGVVEVEGASSGSTKEGGEEVKEDMKKGTGLGLS